jgi:hypothetical protein
MAIQVEFPQRQVATATLGFAITSATLTGGKVETNFPPTHSQFPSSRCLQQCLKLGLTILKPYRVLFWLVNKSEFTFTFYAFFTWIAWKENKACEVFSHRQKQEQLYLASKVNIKRRPATFN